MCGGIGTNENESYSQKICVLCNVKFIGYGNNATPLADGLCCELCNEKVIKERLRLAGLNPSQKKLI